MEPYRGQGQPLLLALLGEGTQEDLLLPTVSLFRRQALLLSTSASERPAVLRDLALEAASESYWPPAFSCWGGSTWMVGKETEPMNQTGPRQGEKVALPHGSAVRDAR